MEAVVFIDTNLGTRLALPVSSDSETISDLKRTIRERHPLLFPNTGEITINAMKMKCSNGYFYHLDDTVLVTSAFVGVGGCWCLSVDASVAEEHTENLNSIEPNISDSSDLVPADTGKRNETLLLQYVDDRHVKQNSASQQFGSNDPIKENTGDLRKEAEHSANSNSQVPFPAQSRSNVESKDVGNDKICEDQPACVATPVSKKKLKSKKRKRDAIHHDLKEKGALVVVGEKDALGSGNVKENLFQNGPSLVLNDANLGNQIRVDETSSRRKKRSAARKRMVDERTEYLGENPELETNGHKDVSCNDQEHNTKDNSLQSGPATTKKRKLEKKDCNENSLMENVEQDTGLDTLGQKQEFAIVVVDHLNTEFVNQNQLSAANGSVGKKKRRRQKLKVSEVSPSKDVHEDTFQAIYAIKDKDLGSIVVKRSMGGEISEPCLISPMNIQEVSERNRVLHPGGDADMDDANDGNIESKNEAPEPAVASVTNMRGSCDQNSSQVDGHPTQESINFRKAFGVSAHEDNLEVVEENVEQNKSSKKARKSKKSKGLVGGTEAVNAVRNSTSPAEHSTFSSDNVEQGGTADGKEEIKMKKSDCSPLFGVSAHEDQSDNLEVVEENVEQNKSSKKARKSKKSKGLAGGTEAVNAVLNSTSPAKHSTFASDNVEQGDTADGKEEIKMKKLDCSPLVGVSAHKDQSDNLEVVEENVEQNKSSKKVRKSKKKSKGLVGGTEAVNALRNSTSPAEHSTFASDNVEQGGTADGKEEIKMKKSDCSPLVTDVRADDVIQDVLESLKQCNNGPENGENMEQKSKKKTKKSSTLVVPSPELQGKDDVDHRGPTVMVHNVSASSKSTWKTVKANSSSVVQLNGSDLESDKNTPKPQHDGRPIQDVVGVDQPKSTCVDNANKSKELPDGSEALKSQQRLEIVDSGEIIIGKVIHKTEVETAVKGNKKNSKSELSSSDILNGNKRNEAKAQPVKSSSIQSQRSSLKSEPSTPLLTVSGSAVKEPQQFNGSDKIGSTPKTVQRPIDINSSRARTDLKKNKTRDVSSSALKTPKSTINLKKGGNEPQTHLDIAKAPGSDSRNIANSSTNKKSLLATMGTIFRHDDGSSDDEDGVSNSDSSTRTPSDSPSSYDYSGNSHENGSCNSEGEETSGRKTQKPGSSSSKSMSLHAILLNSSSFKKAKQSASQAIDSQPEEFVPESQPT